MSDEAVSSGFELLNARNRECSLLETEDAPFFLFFVGFSFCPLTPAPFLGMIPLLTSKVSNTEREDIVDDIYLWIYFEHASWHLQLLQASDLSDLSLYGSSTWRGKRGRDDVNAEDCSIWTIARPKDDMIFSFFEFLTGLSTSAWTSRKTDTLSHD